MKNSFTKIAENYKKNLKIRLENNNEESRKPGPVMRYRRKGLMNGLRRNLKVFRIKLFKFPVRYLQPEGK